MNIFLIDCYVTCLDDGDKILKYIISQFFIKPLRCF